MNRERAPPDPERQLATDIASRGDFLHTKVTKSASF